MEQVYGFNDRKEKVKFFSNIRKEIVDLHFGIVLQKYENGIYRNYKVYGVENNIPLPIVFHKYGTQILLTLAWNVQIDNTTGEFDYKKNNDGSANIVIPFSDLPATKWRLYFFSTLPDKYKKLEVLFNDQYNAGGEYNGYEIKDIGTTLKDFWFITNRQLIDIYINKEEASTWAYSIFYIGDNTD